MQEQVKTTSQGTSLVPLAVRRILGVRPIGQRNDGDYRETPAQENLTVSESKPRKPRFGRQMSDPESGASLGSRRSILSKAI